MASGFLNAMLVAVTASGAVPVKGGTPRGAAPIPGARTVVLDDTTARGAIPVRAARNLLTTDELPEDVVGDLMCGNCSIGKEGNPDALFRVEKMGDGRYLAITTAEPARRARPVDPITNLIVHLEHTTVMLKLVRVDKASAADMRVVLAYPNRKNESEYVRVEKAKLEAESAARIESEVSGRFLRAFAEPHHCSRKGARARNDDIVLEVTELCYFGREVILSFTVENRGRVPVEIGSVVVNRGTSKREYLSDRTVEFQKVSSGVVSLQLPESDATGKFDLTVLEGTGKRRTVTVGGVEF